MNSGLSPVEKALRMIERLRTVHPRMELQTAMILMLIAAKKEITKPQLETLMANDKGPMSTGSSWRNLELLQSEKLIHVEKRTSGSIVTMTPHGQRLVESITEYIGSD